MKNNLLFLLFILATYSTNANIVLTSAGGTVFQSGVPFSMDLTFSNLPSTCSIGFVIIDYSVVVTPACVSSMNVKTIGGTYWGSGVGGNPSLLNTVAGGSPFPISSNMLPIFSGLSANAIVNIVTDNGYFPNGATITVQATARYYTSATSTIPCATEVATPVTVSIIALNYFSANINTTCATATMGGAQIYDLIINGGSVLGSSNLYSVYQNLTFYFAPCLTVYNVYDAAWSPVPYTLGPAGILKFSTGNIMISEYRIYRVVLKYPCPGAAPCITGNNMATSFHVSGTDICGNYMAFASPINNCIITGACGSGVPSTPIPLLNTGFQNSSSILCPGACNLVNFIQIDNPTVFSYPNSTLDYTMPNTTDLKELLFAPSLPSSTSLSISYNGTGCPSGPYSTVLSGASLTNLILPPTVNTAVASCTSKTIHIALPAPMISPFSTQKVYYMYNVSNAAPSSGLASFPFTFNSSVLSSAVSAPFNVPYVSATPSIFADSKILSGGNCVYNEYYNPGQYVTFRLSLIMTNPTPLLNMVLTNVLNPNILIDPSYGIKFHNGFFNSCLGLPFVNAAFMPNGTNFSTGTVAVAGNLFSAAIATASNQLSISCPSLSGAPICSQPRFLTIEFRARVKPGTPVGSYANTFMVNGSNISTINSSTAFAIVNSYYEISLRMKVKRDIGIFADQLTTCLCQASPLPNANKISYRGELVNTGNVTLKDIHFFNMKPKGGDFAFQSCAALPRGTSASVNGVTSYNHSFNTANSMYSIVPLNYPNSYNSGFWYSGGPIPMNSIDATYYNSGNANFNAPQLPMCTACPSCLPFVSVSTPVPIGSAMYKVQGVSGSTGINLNGGQTLSFYTNPVCIQNVASGTQLVNDFYIQGTRQDLNMVSPVVRSNKAVVTVNASGCPASGCDTSILKWAQQMGDYRRYYFMICNQSGVTIHKIKVDILPVGCFSTAYSYTQNLTAPLAPGACTTIQNSTAMFPNLLYPPSCPLVYKVTLYTQTSTSVPVTYDSCSRTTNWIQMPVRIKNDEEIVHDEVLVYPIPANDFLKVNATDYFYHRDINTPQFDIRIADISGKNVLTKTCNNFEEEISLHGLAPGLYFYTIVYDHVGIQYDKFVKE